ncbi:MAG: transglutaminase domain-containing protein [Bacteroidetes bacterium]|nr:transglutaminase domain-containing protein [Bacteroidota bacterium]
MQASRLLLIVPSLVLSLALLSQEASSQERRYMLLREGVACGEISLTVERLRNGYVQYSFREERTLLTIADERETQLYTLTILADTALHVVSLEGRQRSGNREWRLHGSRAGGTLHLSREDGTGRMERWRSDGEAIPDILLPELLRREGGSSPQRVLFIRDLQDHPASIEITREGEVFHISIDRLQEFEVDAHGHVLSWQHVDHGLAWRPTASAASTRQLCDLDCGVFWDGGQALLPTRRENIRRLDVLLQLTGDVGARLTPIDFRQTARKDVATEENSVTVSVEMRRGRFEEATLPVLDEDVLPYLGGDDLLPVRSPLIRDRAGMLRNWDRNVANVARDILHWCGREFTYDPFLPVIPADRLVRDPRGTVLHAAMLFVTLARSAGVPARFVLGLTPSEGRWHSTVWVEVWSGEWVSVDPAEGRIIDDAVSVKLLHTADVAELRTQAAKLQNVLRIELRDVESIDSSVAGDLETGIVGRMYTNRRYRCSFQAPKGWLLEERQLGDEIVVIATPQLGSDVRFELHLFRNPYRLHTIVLYETRLRTILGVLIEPVIEEKGEMKFGSQKAPYVVYSYRESSAGKVEQRRRTADCIFGRADRGYDLRFTAPMEAFHEYENELQGILRSVNLYERD